MSRRSTLAGHVIFIDGIKAELKKMKLKKRSKVQPQLHTEALLALSVARDRLNALMKTFGNEED